MVSPSKSSLLRAFYRSPASSVTVSHINNVCRGTRCRFNRPLAARSSLLAEHLVVKPDRINEVLSTAGSLTRTADALRAAGVAPWFSARCRT